MTTHSKVTLAGLVSAIETALSAISGSVVSIGEGIADSRTIQVYPSEFEGAKNSRTDRNTLGGGLRLRRYVIRVDVYSVQRANLDENITTATTDAYSVIGVLESQTTSPAFGLSGVHTFHWTGRLGVFQYAGVEYWGSQFTLEFMCH